MNYSIQPIRTESCGAMNTMPDGSNTMERSAAVVWLGESACHDPRSTGGKAAALSRLAERYIVPHGFCVTSTAFAGITPPVRLPSWLRDRVLAAYSVLPASNFPVAVRSSAVDQRWA